MPSERAEEVVAEALREWQRNLGSPLAPTTLWIDKAEVPAKVAIDALKAAGFALVKGVGVTHDELREMLRGDQ